MDIVSKIPEGAVQVHLYRIENVLRPRGGTMRKESISQELMDHCISAVKSWTDQKYGDSVPYNEAVTWVVRNLREEVEMVVDQLNPQEPKSFRIEVSDQQLKDCLVTAVEGGIRYWAFCKDYDPEAARVTIEEIEPSRPEPAGPLKMTLSHLDLLRGLELLARVRPEGEFEGAPGHLRDFLSNNSDAITADVIVQLAMFGELVYG